MTYKEFVRSYEEHCRELEGLGVRLNPETHVRGYPIRCGLLTSAIFTIIAKVDPSVMGGNLWFFFYCYVLAFVCAAALIEACCEFKNHG